jgi:hypothetical protein
LPPPVHHAVVTQMNADLVARPMTRHRVMAAALVSLLLPAVVVAQNPPAAAPSRSTA